MDKAALRDVCRRRLRREEKKEQRSYLAAERFLSLPALDKCTRLSIYAATAQEVRTYGIIERCLGVGREVILPFVDGLELGLLRILSADELEPGAFGIMEPEPALRLLPDRQRHPSEIHIFVVPGLAFDKRGGRLGRGMGYYDRLLASRNPNAVVVGLAFESQIVSEVPMTAQDVPVDLLVSEKDIYDCRGIKTENPIFSPSAKGDSRR